MSTSAHIATSALSMDHSARYKPLTECIQFNRTIAMISIFVLYVFANVASSNDSHMHILVVSNLL